jgi:hypothetical protein
MSIAIVSGDAFRAIALLYFVIRHLVASFIFLSSRQPRREQAIVYLFSLLKSRYLFLFNHFRLQQSGASYCYETGFVKHFLHERPISRAAKYQPPGKLIKHLMILKSGQISVRRHLRKDISHVHHVKMVVHEPVEKVECKELVVKILQRVIGLALVPLQNLKFLKTPAKNPPHNNHPLVACICPILDAGLIEDVTTCFA